MKKSFVFILIFIFALPVLSQDFKNVKYISNYDGDTIKFDLGDNLPEIFRYIPLRLYGIDTPEIKSKCTQEKISAQKAKKFVADELTNADTINLTNCKSDKYFRINCCVEYYILNEKKDLTDQLLKNNFGYKYYGGKKQKHF